MIKKLNDILFTSVLKSGTAREEGPVWFVPKSMGHMPSMLPPGSYVSETMFFEQAAPTECVPHAGKRIFLCPYSLRTISRMRNMTFDQTTKVPKNSMRCGVLHKICTKSMSFIKKQIDLLQIDCLQN